MASTAEFIHEPDPANPGWFTWRLNDESCFNSYALGEMIIRPEGNRGARLRLLETRAQHGNIHGNVHGGVTLALIDVAMFGTIFVALGADAAGSVTLDLHNQFIGAGYIGQPLDVVSEVIRETRRLVFMRGTVVQGDHLVASYIGTLRKPSSR